MINDLKDLMDLAELADAADAASSMSDLADLADMSDLTDLADVADATDFLDSADVADPFLDSDSLSLNTELDCNNDLNGENYGNEIAFGAAPNDGTYLHTSEDVNVQCCGGANKGNFDVYRHNGQKYINFKNQWIRISKFGYFSIGGNQYYVK